MSNGEQQVKFHSLAHRSPPAGQPRSMAQGLGTPVLIIMILLNSSSLNCGSFKEKVTNII